MEKPVGIKDAKALAYIAYLEKQIDEFKTHTKKKFYLGIQRQLDLLGDEMLDESFKVSMKKTFTKSNDDSGKMKVVDTGFEGFFDMITKGEAIIKAMEKFEQQAFPQLQQDSKKKVVKLEGVEEYLKENG